jgi:hypothetical protein
MNRSGEELAKAQSWVTNDEALINAGSTSPKGGAAVRSKSLPRSFRGAALLRGEPGIHNHRRD